nr:retrovirus-related Pol polyprotein from transposon TNT 1-94 [Tanacetum cinerariifolium]
MVKSSSNLKNEVFDDSFCSTSCKKNTKSLNTKITELSEKLCDSKTMLYHYKLGLSQRSKKNKEGLGYSVVAPPPAQVYSPSKKDMSWTGLPEFADDTITDHSRPSSSIKSNSSDLQNSNSSVFKHGESSKSIMYKPMIKFVKAADCADVKTNKVEAARKPSVKYAEVYRNTYKSPKVRGNQRNWNNLKTQQLGKDFVMKNKACFNYGQFDHLAYNCGLWVEKGKSWRKNNYTNKSMSPRTIFRNTGRRSSVNRPNMNVVQPKRTSFAKPAHSYVRRPFHGRSAVRTQSQVPMVPTVTKRFPTVGSKFSTIKSTFSTDWGNKRKAVKASACWIWRPIQNTTEKCPNCNSVSVIFKKYQYIDTQGRLKFVMALVSKKYVRDNEVLVVHRGASSVPSDAFMMIYDDICEPHDQSVSYPSRNTVVKNSLTAELAIYKEHVKLYEQRAKFELTEREQKINKQLRIVISGRNIKEETLKRDLHSIKLQLASTIKHNKSMVEEVSFLKKDFKQKENKYLADFLNIKTLKEKVKDKLIKQDHSLQTIHMLCKPRPNSNELKRVAIGYNNPLYLTRAKQAQPALYNDHEIIKENHMQAIVHNSEDTLEIAEIIRKKMNEKMNDPECVTHKVKIAPYDYSKDNLLATFTPQKQLTPEQIFWSNDLMKIKSKALKERTKVSRPIKVFMVYPPNTPTALVPKVLPTKSQVKILIFTLIQLFSELDQTCKKRITPSVITDGERGFEQTKTCYLQEDNQTELINHFSKLEVSHLNLQLKYQDLKDQIGNSPPTPDKDTPDFDSVFAIGKMQAFLQGKDNVIRQLKKELSQLQVTHQDTDRTLRVQTTDSQITKLTDQVTKVTTENMNLKISVSKAMVNPLVSARDKHAIDVEPIAPRLRNNRNAHLDYLRHLKESVETIRDIVEEAKVINVPVPPSTRVDCCPIARGSQPMSHVKPNRISPAKGDTKLPIDDKPRKNKSHLRTLTHKMSDVNAPSDQTLTMDPPIRTDDQILPHIRAFTASSNLSSIYIQQFWDTILYDKKARCYKCQLDEQWFDLTKETLREALQVTPVNRNQAFAASPSINGLIDFINQLGYLNAKGAKREIIGMPIPERLITANIQAAPYDQEYQENPAPTLVPAKTQENKRKQATGTTDKPAKAKRIKRSVSRNTRQSRGSPKSVGVSEAEEVPAKEHEVAKEDADFQKAMEESMKDAYALPKGPLPPVVIREPESGKYQPLPEVTGKGKAKVSEEQVAHDLLSLPKHKKTSPADQYIFQRRVFEPTASSFYDASLYEVLGQSNSDEESKKVGPNPGNVEARVQSTSSPVVHAGSDREHMDIDVANVSLQPFTEQLYEGFTAMIYPNVQENLKLAVEEPVLLEELASSSGTLSSLQHLSRDFTFGDQFFSDKPSDADKSAETKEHPQIKATTTNTTTTTTTTLPPPQAPQQSTTEAMMVKRIDELEHTLDDLIEVNKTMEERLDKHGARLYTLKQLDIPQQVSIAETDSYKSHEVHMQLFEALEKSINRNQSEELTHDLAEAQKKRKKGCESPKMPPGSPSHQPTPPPPAGPSGTSGASRASRSKVTAPPPPPTSTNQDSPSTGSAAPSPAKTAATTKHQAWSTPDVTLKPLVSSTPEDLDMDEAMGPDEQAQLSDEEDTRSAHIPMVNLR